MLAALLVLALGAAPAEDAFRAALAATSPTDAAALCKLGSWCETQGRPAWAARCYKRAVALGKGPSFAAASLGLAKIELANKDYQAAYRRLRDLEGGDTPAGVMAEVREILRKAATQTTAKQRQLVADGDGFLGQGNFAKARDAFAEAYRLVPSGETSADFIPAGEILTRLARCVEALDNAYYRQTAQPFASGIQQCKRCEKEGGFEKCARCAGTGTVKQTYVVLGKRVTRNEVCTRCKGFKWRLCETCRGMQNYTDYKKLNRDEFNALDNVINRVRNVETLKLSLDGALKDIEKTILQVEKAATLTFFRSIVPSYSRSKELRAAITAVPPPAEAMLAAAAAWKEARDLLTRSNFLSSYAIEFAISLRAYDCLRGTRKRPDFAKAPQATALPSSPVMPEVLSAFPEEGTTGWIVVKGRFEGYEEKADEPEKGVLRMQGAVPHNVTFFVWLPAAKPGLERLERGPWRERLAGLARSYPFAAAEKARAAPAGYEVVVVGRFLRDRLGFPRNWFEVWDLSIGMTPSQEALYRILEEPVDLTYAAIELGNLAQILRFFGIETELSSVERTRAVSCNAAACPLGIFIEFLAGFLGTTWACEGDRVTIGGGSAAARTEVELVLALMRKAHEKSSYTVEIGNPEGDAGTGAPPAGEPQSPAAEADGVPLEEQARRAFAAMQYEKARDHYRALAAQAAEPKDREELERAEAAASLFQTLTEKTPVSHLAAAEKVRKIVFKSPTGKEITMVVAVVEELPNALVVRMSYGGSLRINTQKNRILDQKVMARAEWRAQKAAELRELEKGAQAGAPRDRVNALFLVALFAKTNRFTEKGTAALEGAIADDAFEWILDTYFAADKQALAAVWRRATGREAPAVAAAPKVAEGSGGKEPASAVPEFKGEVDPDAPLPSAPGELRRVARALYRDGRGALSRALPGMEKASTWRKEALKRFSKAQEALMLLGGTVPADVELEALTADVAFMMSKCVKDLGFFD